MRASITISLLVSIPSITTMVMSLPHSTSNGTLAIPPRFQWEANYGYCGEVSMISAGLYFGQYVSQYDARAIASNGTNQAREGSQLLLGVNDAYAASKMHLSATQWKGSGTSAFLAWVKSNVIQGWPTIVGVYTNEYAFYDSTDPNDGDAEYDHIVPVLSISSNHPLTLPAQYYPDDRIQFSDNGLYGPDDDPAGCDYLRNYPFSSFQATRQQANARKAPLYSLPKSVNYGIAIKGIIDNDGQTVPVRVATNVNYEKPSMKDGSNTRPTSLSLTLTVTVSNLKAGTKYNLYRYSSLSSTPESSFNAKASQASKRWLSISGDGSGKYRVTENIQSNQMAIYRAVPITAP